MSAVRLLRPALGALRVSALVSRGNSLHGAPSSALVSRGLHTTGVARNQNIVNIQDADDFQEKVIKAANPVIVDFHASWCGPCKILGPRLESLVAANDGKVLMAKVDIDDNSELAIDHGVQAVPTVIGMKGGQVVDKFVGVKDSDELDAFMKKLIG